MIRIALLTIYALMATVVQAADAQVLSGFFGKGGIENKAAKYHGEMLLNFTNKPTLGEGLPKSVNFTYRLINETSSHANYAVHLSDDRYSEDWYAFLIKDKGIWKLNAVRKLAQTGIIYQAMLQLEKKAERSNKEEWQYQNMKMVFKSDNELKEYLRNNIEAFNNIVEMRKRNRASQVSTIVKKLYLSSVREFNGILELNIGGIIDNAVGYLYVAPGKKAPIMSPKEYIYIENIVDGWYIYKTT